MDGDLSGRGTFAGLPRRSAPHRRWRWASRRRIGPLRTVAEASDHPILSGIRSGAVTGFVIVTVLSLPVLLVLGAKAPAPTDSAARTESAARAWAGTAEEADASVRVWAEPSVVPVPVPAVLVEPSANRSSSAEPAWGGENRSVLSLDLIPVLDDESGALLVEEAPMPVAKPGRRAAAAPRNARTPD